MRMSQRGAKRSLDEFNREENPNALFGIVQGGMFEHLRDESLAGLEEIGFHGIAIGGLSVGEPKEDMMRVLQHIGPRLPVDRSEEHTSELQSLMRISYAVFCLKKKTQ